jgi:hypothetical protein
MMHKLIPSINKQIRNLLIVVFGGVAAAVLITASMLYRYNPSGRYDVKNALLSPLALANLSLADTNPKTGKNVHFVFDEIDFSYFDEKKKEWKHATVKMPLYEQFYNLISGERSTPATEIITLKFNQDNPAMLALRMKSDANSDLKATSKPFLVVHFAKQGDYYRIQLHDEVNPEAEWAYFYHPGIYSKAMQLFLNQ